MTIGIDRLAVYVPGGAVAPAALAAAGAGPRTRGVETIAVPAPCEDVVTLAATAGVRLLRAARIAPASIGFLAVASAWAPRGARPLARHVHELLGLGSRCRSIDVVAGTYGSTAAVALAADWVRAGGIHARRALVVAADVAPVRMAATCLPGAAAVAMFVSLEPRALLLGGTGVPAVPPRAPGVARYAAALAEAFDVLRDAERPPLEPAEAFTDRMARMIYQADDPLRARTAHRLVLERDWRAARGRWPATAADADAAIARAIAEQVEPWTAVLAQVGNAGAAAPYLALAATLERDGRRLGGRRVALFGFGAACGGELVTGVVPAGVDAVAEAGVAAQLAGRVSLDAATVSARAGRPVAGDPPADFRGEFLFVGRPYGRRAYAGRLVSAD